MGFLYPVFGAAAKLSLLALSALFVTDILLLFAAKNSVHANRIVPKKLSNGDENTIRIKVINNYNFEIRVGIIDELPHQFQIRDFNISITLDAGEERLLTYQLRPTERGDYEFGSVNVFGTTLLGLAKRKHAFGTIHTVPVYPSFIQMRKFELYAISNRLTEIGVKKVRRIGHTLEFDQIKNYVPGDDVRSINWKATARANELMVNQYQDERSQPVINVIDMGRVMKMPFDGLHLLDYAINTSLVISNIALMKHDRAGLVTFSNNDTVVVKPEQKRTHIQKIQETLYNLKTNFLESDFERLYGTLRRHITHRSLILLYTNFETLSSMKRQLPYLQRIANDHLLVTIFFENTELSKLIEEESKTLGDIYTKTIAEEFAFEKREIVRYLNQRGIQTILTPPKELSVNAINKYLELKARGLI